MGKIAKKAVCWSVILAIWHCILSAELTKTHHENGLKNREKKNVFLQQNKHIMIYKLPPSHSNSCIVYNQNLFEVSKKAKHNNN